MPVICERGLLNLLEVSPHFLKPYSRHYLLALSTETTWRASPHERSLVFHEQPLVSGKHWIFGTANTHFVFAYTNALDESDMRLRAQWRFTAVFCGGKRCKKVLEDALRAPASSYEALLLSAGKCGQSPGKRLYWRKSWICKCAMAWSLHSKSRL